MLSYHAIKFARWQHHAMICGARFAETGVTCLSCFLFRSSSASGVEFVPIFRDIQNDLIYCFSISINNDGRSLHMRRHNSK